MMVGSVFIERFRSRDWVNHSTWWIVAAAALLVTATVLIVLGTRNNTSGSRQLAIVNELQVLARDVSSSSLLAMSGDAAALTKVREQSAGIDSALDVLAHGGDYKGGVVAPAAGAIQSRLDDVTAQWGEFRHRAEAILLLDSKSGAPGSRSVSSTRLPEQRAGTKGLSDNRAPPGTSSVNRRASHGTAAGAPVHATGRGAESGWGGISLLQDGHAFAAAADSLRSDMDAQPAYRPWMLLAALVCVLGALAAMTALGATLRRGVPDPQASAAPADTALLDVLRPAIRSLNVYSKGTAQPDPLVLARRLSDAILEVVDGMRRVVRTLNATTAEANRSAAAGRQAAQIVANALHEEAAASTNLRTSMGRNAAAQSALATRAAEVQRQSSGALEIVGIGLDTAKDSVRRAAQMKTHLEGLTGTHKEIAQLNNAIVQSLAEISDLSTQAEVLALRAGIRLAPQGEGEVTEFVAEVQGYLGSSAAEIKRVTELMHAVQLKSGTFSEQLERTVRGAVNQSCNADDASRALANADTAIRQLAGSVAVLTRLAAGSDSSPLLSAMDDIAEQVRGTAASAQQVLDATKDTAERIEGLAKLLSDLRPT